VASRDGQPVTRTKIFTRKIFTHTHGHENFRMDPDLRHGHAHAGVGVTRCPPLVESVVFRCASWRRASKYPNRVGLDLWTSKTSCAHYFTPIFKNNFFLEKIGVKNIPSPVMATVLRLNACCCEFCGLFFPLRLRFNRCLPGIPAFPSRDPDILA